MSTGAEGVDGLAYSDAMLHYRVDLGGLNVNDAHIWDRSISKMIHSNLEVGHHCRVSVSPQLRS